MFGEEKRMLLTTTMPYNQQRKYHLKDQYIARENNWIFPWAIVSNHKSNKPDKCHAMLRSKHTCSHWIFPYIHYQSVSTMVETWQSVIQSEVQAVMPSGQAVMSFCLCIPCKSRKIMANHYAIETSKTLCCHLDKPLCPFANASHAKA